MYSLTFCITPSVYKKLLIHAVKQNYLFHFKLTYPIPSDLPLIKSLVATIETDLNGSSGQFVQSDVTLSFKYDDGALYADIVRKPFYHTVSGIESGLQQEIEHL